MEISECETVISSQHTSALHPRKDSYRLSLKKDRSTNFLNIDPPPSCYTSLITGNKYTSLTLEF
ncbi:hypothetical protein E2C01_101004 [Portunus trituberculatus]|uniref:Uncharacterized protein n=1 Tax=Portunus trituberculatus TaxID=210409 RepID=A0A5B7K8F3_PORTR|nr:hypothetical protein [Portunus trituberculatus]